MFRVINWRGRILREKLVNQKAAESLADPEEYPNLFEDWQVALGVETKVAETRSHYPPAAEYINHINRSSVNLVEAFRNMHVNEDELHATGLDHEESEQNGNEMPEEGHNDQKEGNDEFKEDSHDEAIVVDADSADGAVLVNGNEADEEWGTNNAGNPSA